MQNDIYNFRFVEQIRAHFYTPFDVLCDLRFFAAPKPPLCKGRWHGEAVTEGLVGNLSTRYKLIPAQRTSMKDPFEPGWAVLRKKLFGQSLSQLR